MNDLRARLGLALESDAIVLVPARATAPTCGQLSTLLEEALAFRPDVRAAELAIEAAGERLGWERSKVLSLTAVLDANGEGSEGFEAGPGIDVAIPLFDRNQAGRARAAAELERAMRNYAATRQRVATELRRAMLQLEQATAAVTDWHDTILEPLEAQVRAAQRAFEEGEASYLFLLTLQRRLTDARLGVREAEADAEKAIVWTERAVGRRCGTAGTEITRGF
jgi:cobalt-zinc-cadmium efflux system outer membrane protein